MPPPGQQHAPVRPGFDKINEDGTTTPFDASGLPIAGMPYPPNQSSSAFSAFPQGFQPQSLSGQMAALEVDEIPEAFKLSRKEPGKGKLIALIGVLVVCVVAGVLLGVLVFGGDKKEAPNTRDIELVSIPKAATVFIDGEEIDEKTPTDLKGIKVGTKYVIKMTLPDHEPWEEERTVAEDGTGDVKVIARLKPIVVKLTVKSIPEGADVIIGGTPKGRTPLVLDELNPKETTYVELRRRGFKAQRQDLDWADKTEQVVEVRLKPSK
jgi:hypothetical protein